MYYNNFYQIKYSSPDGIRPNIELESRRKKNFNNLVYPKGPNPNTLPLPPQHWLKNINIVSDNNIIVNGKNRIWIIKKKQRKKYFKKIYFKK